MRVIVTVIVVKSVKRPGSLTREEVYGPCAATAKPAATRERRDILVDIGREEEEEEEKGRKGQWGEDICWKKKPRQRMTSIGHGLGSVNVIPTDGMFTERTLVARDPLPASPLN